MLLGSGDLLRPANQALVRYSGSVLSFCFGKGFERVFQLLLKSGAVHMRRLSLERTCTVVGAKEVRAYVRMPTEAHHTSKLAGPG